MSHFSFVVLKNLLCIRIQVGLMGPLGCKKNRFKGPTNLTTLVKLHIDLNLEKSRTWCLKEWQLEQTVRRIILVTVWIACMTIVCSLHSSNNLSLPIIGMLFWSCSFNKMYGLTGHHFCLFIFYPFRLSFVPFVHFGKSTTAVQAMGNRKFKTPPPSIPLPFTFCKVNACHELHGYKYADIYSYFNRP